MRSAIVMQTDGRDDMVRLDGGTFRIGSDQHYPKEALLICIGLFASFAVLLHLV